MSSKHQNAVENEWKQTIQCLLQGLVRFPQGHHKTIAISADAYTKDNKATYIQSHSVPVILPLHTHRKHECNAL